MSVSDNTSALAKSLVRVVVDEAKKPKIADNGGPDPAISELIVSLSEKYETDSELALAIARCESHLRHYDTQGILVRGRVNSSDIGVFQINERFHAKVSRELGFDIYTPEGNIAYGLWMLKSMGTKPWKASQTCWDQLAKR